MNLYNDELSLQFKLPSALNILIQFLKFRDVKRATRTHLASAWCNSANTMPATKNVLIITFFLYHFPRVLTVLIFHRVRTAFKA